MTRRTKRTEAPQSNSNGLFVVLVLCAVSFFAGYSWQGQSHVAPKPDDGKQQVLPDDGKQQPVVKAQGYLYFVHDRQATSIDEINLIDAADDFCKQQQGLEVRVIEATDDSEGAMKVRKLGESKNVKPPYVVFRNINGNVTAIENPQSLEAIKKVLK
jgi:hypothetical protein